MTRLDTLRDAEKFIKADIPLVASVAFGRGGLDGAYLLDARHLMVVTGFTKSGAVIVNDPPRPGTRRCDGPTSRSQFEKAWLKGSGGIVYVIRPTSRALPGHQPLVDPHRGASDRRLRK